MSKLNAVPVSPLTVDGCIRRITWDLHPGRWDSAAAIAIVHLGAVADGRLAAFEAELVLRGLAEQADPDGYAEAVRLVLGEGVEAL